MPALELQTACLEHISHTASLGVALFNRIKAVKVECRCTLFEQMFREGLLDVDPTFEVVRNEQVLSLGFFGEMISIEVTTGHEDKLTAKNALVSEEKVHLFECFIDWNSCINLFLSDAGQLSAKWCELRINCGLDICLIDRLNGFLFHVDNHNRELNDLLRIDWEV